MAVTWWACPASPTSDRTTQAPGYAASKAGLTSYLLGLRGALRPHGVRVTIVRFGFVDTKMAKSPVKPLLLSVERAADVGCATACVPGRRSSPRPRRMAALARAARVAATVAARR